MRSLEGGGGIVIAYTDSVAFDFLEKFGQTLCNLITERLGLLSAWPHKNRFGVNPSKTELVLFTRKFKIRSSTRISHYRWFGLPLPS